MVLLQSKVGLKSENNHHTIISFQRFFAQPQEIRRLLTLSPSPGQCCFELSLMLRYLANDIHIQILFVTDLSVYHTLCMIHQLIISKSLVPQHVAAHTLLAHCCAIFLCCCLGCEI